MSDVTWEQAVVICVVAVCVTIVLVTFLRNL